MLVARFEDDGVDSIDEQICHAAGVRRHERHAKGGRFQNDVGETVVEGRNDDGIACHKEREEIETIAKWKMRRGDLLVVRDEPGQQLFFDIADQQQMQAIRTSGAMENLEKELHAFFLL